MDLLTRIEKNNVASLLSDYEILGQAVAKLYLAFPNPNSWSYSNIVGVVSIVRKLNSFSFKIVDVEKKEIIWEYDIDSNMTYEQSEDYLHVFPYKTIKCMAGFSFTDESEGQEFYNCVINRNTSTKVSPVSSRISSPKIPTISPVSPVNKSIDNESKNKVEKKKHKKEKKSKKGLFGFGSSKSKKKGKIDKSLIGKPTNFRHEQYIGYDPEKGFVTQNASPEWQEIFKKAGITPEILADDRSRKIVNKFIQKHESQIRSQSPVVTASIKKDKRPPPPPPPPKKRAPPPPPPARKPANQSRKAPPPPPPQRKKQQKAPPPPPPSRKPVKQHSMPPPPPPPQRPATKSSISIPPPPPPQRPAVQSSISIPPPPPQRPTSKSTTSIPPAPAASIPPPPPPPPVSGGIPPPPPPPPVSGGIPPPPPPPPVSGGIPPPPPAPVSRSAAPPPPPPPPVPSSGNAKSDLLASIRNAGGISSLKHVNESEKRDASGLITPGSASGPKPAPVGTSSGPKIGMSGDLLASIRNAGGISSLKHVDKSKIRDASGVSSAASSKDTTNDLAAALAQALSLRNDAFNGDDDSDSESDDSDSDSSEWSD